MKQQIKIPVKINDVWFCCFLSKKGKITKSATAGHINEKSCVTCCDNYNKFIGYKKKEVKELIKQIQNGKEQEKKGKRKKTKNKGN